MTEEKKPKVNSQGQKELDKLDKQFKDYEQNIKELTMERMNEAPKQEVEAQTKIAQKDLENTKDHYIKPFKTQSVPHKEKFNENFREDWNHAKEYVQFIAEHKECIGDTIEMWTKPFAGVPAEFWQVPTNRPIWAPRYVAEQIKGRKYHRLKTQDGTLRGGDQMGTYTGQLVVDTEIQRLDAIPVSKRKSIFMGASGF